MSGSGYGSGGTPGYIPDSNGGMYGRMQPEGMGMMQGGYGQYSPDRQYGGQRGMGLRNIGGAPTGGLQDYGGLQSGGGVDGYSGAAPTDGLHNMGGVQSGGVQDFAQPGALPSQGQKPAYVPRVDSSPPYVMNNVDTPVGQSSGLNPNAALNGGLLGGDPSNPIRQAPQSQPQMGLRNMPGSSMGSPPPMGGAPSSGAPFGSAGNPWLTRSQLDAQSGDVNYGRPNPGLGDTGGMQQPGGNQDAGAYPPGFQFERGNSTLDPRSMEFLTRWMGGSNSPWGPTQQQQVDGYNNWYRQQYPQNGGPQNGGM